jgi:predicted Zn-dependent protease
MNGRPRDELLAEAIRLRRQGKPAEARRLLLDLAAEHPGDAEAAYPTAWVHDVLGLEAEAVPFYEGTLSGSELPDEERRGAPLGLGSTYRVLGRYTQAVSILRQGSAEFPDDGALQTFLAMALFNTGQHHEARQILLKLLATTSEDPHVRQYRRAIEMYAQNLDDTV